MGLPGSRASPYELRNAVGGYLGAVAFSDLNSDASRSFAVGWIAQQGIDRRTNAFAPSVFRKQDACADALKRCADTLLIDQRISGHDHKWDSERQRPHRRAVATMAHHERRGREDFVVVQPRMD
jgi:hypothetical protein